MDYYQFTILNSGYLKNKCDNTVVVSSDRNGYCRPKESESGQSDVGVSEEAEEFFGIRGREEKSQES